MRAPEDSTDGPVWVDGELDLLSAPVLRQYLTGLLDDGVDRLVLDLSRVTFVDCAGAEPLLEADDRLRREGRVWTLRGATPPVAQLLALLQIRITLGHSAGDPAYCSRRSRFATDDL